MSPLRLRPADRRLHQLLDAALDHEQVQAPFAAAGELDHCQGGGDVRPNFSTMSGAPCN